MSTKREFIGTWHRTLPLLFDIFDVLTIGIKTQKALSRMGAGLISVLELAELRTWNRHVGTSWRAWVAGLKGDNKESGLHFLSRRKE